MPWWAASTGDVAGRQLAEFLAAMHRSAARVEALVGALPSAAAGPQHPPSTAQLGRD